MWRLNTLCYFEHWIKGNSVHIKCVHTQIASLLRTWLCMWLYIMVFFIEAQFRMHHVIFWAKSEMLVCCGCCICLPHTWWLKRTEMNFFTVLEAESQTECHWANVGMSVGPHSPVADGSPQQWPRLRPLSPCSCLCLFSLWQFSLPLLEGHLWLWLGITCVHLPILDPWRSPSCRDLFSYSVTFPGSGIRAWCLWGDRFVLHPSSRPCPPPLLLRRFRRDSHRHPVPLCLSHAWGLHVLSRPRTAHWGLCRAAGLEFRGKGESVGERGFQEVDPASPCIDTVPLPLVPDVSPCWEVTG